MAKVLVVDDDPSLLKALGVGLKAAGHEVSVATTGESGLSQTALNGPDVVVLDLGLPDLDGLVVCERIRQWSEVPIIILSAAGEEDRKIRALDSGANDYVTKPFSMGELEARVRAVLRSRASDAVDAPSNVDVTGLSLDLVHHETVWRGARIELTAKEFNLLAYLARHVGRTCTYQMILRAVWGSGYGSEAQYVHTYVHRLRQRLGDEEGQFIQTVSGVGYRLHDAGGK